MAPLGVKVMLVITGEPFTNQPRPPELTHSQGVSRLINPARTRHSTLVAQMPMTLHSTHMYGLPTERLYMPITRRKTRTVPLPQCMPNRSSLLR